jgi:large conductance mechanosensitive channel
MQPFRKNVSKKSDDSFPITSMIEKFSSGVKHTFVNAEHSTLGILGEFKAFISKGNVMDLAVGVIIGGAFQGIVNSLVKDVVTPAITLATQAIFHGKTPVDFQSLAIGAHVVLQNGKPELDAHGNAMLEGGVMIGDFINSVVSFFILAAVVFFLLVKPMNKLMAAISGPTPAPGAPPPPEDIVLLREIRDSLRKPATP